MKVLLIEDDETITDAITEAVLECGVPGLPRFAIAKSKSSALEALNAGTYDLIVCDRRIPTEHDALDAADEHGDSICATARTIVPGTPILILTGYATLDQATALLETGHAADVFGNGVIHPMTLILRKNDLPKALERIVEVAKQISQLEDIEVQWDGPDGDRLSRTELRVIRLFARRQGGTMGRVRPLGGGLSNSRTFELTLQGADGRIRARNVAKVGRLDRIADEERRYFKHVASILDVGAFTAFARKIEVGAGDVGGLFFRLADGYERSLFDITLENPTFGADVVQRLAQIFEPWTASSTREVRSIGDIRRSLVSDQVLREKCEVHLAGLDWHTFERRRVNVNICSQHGDLHGHNVLVSNDGRPVLIDYGDVKTAVASLDFTVLELSLLFHPINIINSEGCPTVELAESWTSVERYTEGSRFCPFIRACRDSALAAAAGPREFYANAYAYAVRQLKYEDTNKDIAIAIIRAVIQEFEEEDE